MNSRLVIINFLAVVFAATILLGKSPLLYKTLKNNTENSVRWGHADEISLLKTFLHNCGRADILSKTI